MTAYIKMIDIWMIFSMLYPFSVVMLYSTLYFVKQKTQNILVPMKIETVEWKDKILPRIIIFLLDFGLPVIVIIFIIIFWVLGIINTASSKSNNSC